MITTNWKNGSTSGTPGTRVDNSYVYWDGAVQSQVRYDANTGSGSNTIFTSTYRYDAFGRLTSASVNDGRPRTVTYTNDVNGPSTGSGVIRRDEADSNTSNGDPHELYYRLAGKQLGAIGNNGTDNVDYKASNDQRSATPGPFDRLRRRVPQWHDLRPGLRRVRERLRRHQQLQPGLASFTVMTRRCSKSTGPRISTSGSRRNRHAGPRPSRSAPLKPNYSVPWARGSSRSPSQLWYIKLGQPSFERT